MNTLKSDLKKRTPLLIACALLIAAALLSSPDVLAEVPARVPAAAQAR
ncbi:MAG TPA: hypothetical protein VM691_08110 [Myxococcales bacterium]|nr:hypothetical protein [Myxococcales bacterium]